MLGKIESRTMEDEMVGWHHWLNGCGFGWTLGVGDGQGDLACCGSWDCKESDTTERWTELIHKWVLNFVKGFFCIYWDYHMAFILQLVIRVYHIDWFAYIEESLHPWNKPNLIMVYEFFNVLLNSVCLNFVEDFLIYVYQWYWPVVFFFCVVFVWFWYQGDGGLVEWSSTLNQFFKIRSKNI